MKYSNDTVRRRDRLLPEADARALLASGEYATLSMAAENGGAYGVPVNYAWDGNDSVYIHCAREGRKLKCVARDPKVSLCVVGKTRVLPEKFSTEYESVILFCRAEIVADEAEKMRALEMLLEKYSPAFKGAGMKYAASSLARAEIARLEILSASGKARRG